MDGLAAAATVLLSSAPATAGELCNIDVKLPPCEHQHASIYVDIAAIIFNYNPIIDRPLTQMFAIVNSIMTISIQIAMHIFLLSTLVDAAVLPLAGSFSRGKP